jgi:Flp pilus assembly protein TadG
MSKIIRNTKKKFARMERGQVLVVVALAAVGIIAIIGLAIDVGIMFIGNARLRRAVDSAALSAALQYRENSSMSQDQLLANLTDSANEFLVLNGFDTPVSTVTDCYNSGNDPALCTNPPRKLVRVYASATVKLAFLPVIGINSVPISATATSEAASLDVVLVIDRSESMTYGPDLAHQLAENDSMRDPFHCNGQSPSDGSGDAGSCQPFDSVINAAVAFTNILYFPYDQVAIVTFDKDPTTLLHLNGDCPSSPCTAATKVIPTLRNLTVYQGDESISGGSANAIFPNGSPSRCYDNRASTLMTSCPICSDTPTWSPNSNYKALFGTGQDPCIDPSHYVNPPDPSHYTTTNIGGGLQAAGNEFATDSRQDALWVVILLTDGVANAGHGNDNGVDPVTYFCPSSTWGLPVRCNHGDPSVRNPAMISGSNNPVYDASDYAYDMADFVGKAYPAGQNALLYTIGLGPEVNKNPQASYLDPYNTDLINYPTSMNEGLGRIFLNYAAHIGSGQAFYAAQPTDLDKIFTLIGTNIATRLSK